MPSKVATKKAKRDLRQGKRPSTAAGEFVRVEMKDIGKGKRAPRSAKQAIAIGLSEARRAGVPVPPNPRKPAARRSRAATGSVRIEARGAARRGRAPASKRGSK